ncbi:MAG: DciA family protein [Phycisphaeraceae bacterium]
MDPHRENERLKRLRTHRVWKDADLSLGFMKKQFKRDIERPYKQLAGLAELWQRLVPTELARHARLDRLNQGILHVAVDSSAHLYELDRLLREGLERELVRAATASPIRRVRLSLSKQAIARDDDGPIDA